MTQVQRMTWINGLLDLVSTTNYADKRIIRLSTTKLRSGTPMTQVQRMTWINGLLDLVSTTKLLSGTPMTLSKYNELRG